MYAGSVLYGYSATLPEIEILVNGQKSVVVERGEVVTITWNAEIIGTREPAGTDNKYPRIFRQLGDTDWRGLLEGAEYLKGTYMFDTSILPLNQSQTFLLYCQGVNGDAGGSISVTAVEREPIELITPEFASYSNGDVVLTAQGSKKMYFSIESDLFGNGFVNDIKFSDASNGIQSATFTNLSDGLYRWFSGYEDGTESSEASYFIVDTVEPQVTVESVWLNLGEEYIIDDIGSGVATARGNPNGAAVIVFTPVDYSSGLGDFLLYKNGQEVTFYNFFNYKNEWLPGEPLGLLDETAQNGDEYTFVVFDNAGNIAFQSVTVSETSNINSLNIPNLLTIPSPTPTVTPTPISAVNNELGISTADILSVMPLSKISVNQNTINNQVTPFQTAMWNGKAESPLSPFVLIDSISADNPAISVDCVFDRQEETYSGILVNRYICTVEYAQAATSPLPKVTINFSGSGIALTGDINGWQKIISPGSFSFVGNASSILACGLFNSGNKSAVALQVNYVRVSPDTSLTPTPTPVQDIESTSWIGNYSGSDSSPVIYKIMAETPATSVTFSTDENSKTFSYIPTLSVCTVKYSQPNPYPVPKVTVFFSGDGYVVTHDNMFNPEQIMSPGSFSFVGNNKDVLALTLHEVGQRDDDHRYGLQVSYKWTYADPTFTPIPNQN